MPQSARKFADLLTEAVYVIAHREKITIQALHDELGYALGREQSAGSALKYWRKGHIPAELDDIEALAQALVERQGLSTAQSLAQFLESAGHPYPQAVLQTCFPAPAPPPPISPAPLPHLGDFYGRQVDLHTLQTWLTRDQIRLLGIFARGGKAKVVWP